MGCIEFHGPGVFRIQSSNVITCDSTMDVWHDKDQHRLILAASDHDSDTQTSLPFTIDSIRAFNCTVIVDAVWVCDAHLTITLFRDGTVTFSNDHVYESLLVRFYAPRHVRVTCTGFVHAFTLMVDDKKRSSSSNRWCGSSKGQWCRLTFTEAQAFMVNQQQQQSDRVFEHDGEKKEGEEEDRTLLFALAVFLLAGIAFLLQRYFPTLFFLYIHTVDILSALLETV